MSIADCVPQLHTSPTRKHHSSSPAGMMSWKSLPVPSASWHRAVTHAVSEHRGHSRARSDAWNRAATAWSAWPGGTLRSCMGYFAPVIAFTAVITSSGLARFL